MKARGFGFLIVAAGRSIERFDCRAGWRSTDAAFSLDGGSASVAFDVHLEDCRVMDKAIDGGERHGVVGEDLAPFAEWLVGGDEERSTLVSRADELEEHACLGLILGDVGDVVED